MAVMLVVAAGSRARCAEPIDKRLATLTSKLRGPHARAASLSLSAYGEAAVPFLLPHTRSPYWLERYWSSAALGQVGGPQTWAILATMLSDRDWRVCVSALFAYSESHAPRKSLASWVPRSTVRMHLRMLGEAQQYVLGKKGGLYVTASVLPILTPNKARCGCTRYVQAQPIRATFTMISWRLTVPTSIFLVRARTVCQPPCTEPFDGRLVVPCTNKASPLTTALADRA